MRYFVRIGGGLALAILFAVLLVRNVDLGQVVLAASRLSMYVLVASAGLVIAGYAVRACRWQLMLRGAGVNATYRQAAPIFFASFALNNVVPLRAGDLYRCVSTFQLPAGTMAKSLGTLLTERLLDLGALIVAVERPLTFPPTGEARIDLASNCGASDRWARPHRSLITFPVATWQLVETGRSAALRPVPGCRESRDMDARPHGGYSRHAVRSSAHPGRRPHVCRLVA